MFRFYIFSWIFIIFTAVLAGLRVMKDNEMHDYIFSLKTNDENKKISIKTYFYIFCPVLNLFTCGLLYTTIAIGSVNQVKRFAKIIDTYL